MDKLAGQLTQPNAAVLESWMAAHTANRVLAGRLADTTQLSQDLLSYAGLDLLKTRKKVDALLAKGNVIRTSRRSIGTKEAIRTSLLIRNAAAVILRAATLRFWGAERRGKGDKNYAGGKQKVPAPGTVSDG